MCIRAAPMCNLVFQRYGSIALLLREGDGKNEDATEVSHMLLVYHGLPELILWNNFRGDSGDSGERGDLDGMNSLGKGLFTISLKIDCEDLVHKMKDTVDEENKSYINCLLRDHPS